METMEVICISSEDETDSQKENKKTKLDHASYCGKMETLSSDDEKVEGSLKRKMIANTKKETQNNMEKRTKLVGQDTVMKLVELIFQPDIYHISTKSDESNGNMQPFKDHKVIEKPKLSDTNNISVKSEEAVSNVQPNKDQEIIEKPKLIVKEKKRISYIAHDVFPLFISLCLQRKSKDNDKEDMEKIVNKLKRRYEELDLEYTSSEHFVTFVNEKRAAIMNNDKKIYVYIGEVMNEMKRRIKKKKSHLLPSNESCDAVPSTSYATNNVPVNNTSKLDYDNDYDNDNEKNTSPKTRKKIKILLQAMAKCEEVIKELDEAEVDFDKEANSNYMKVERYKAKMVELYNKYCELTGDKADAGRAYLRPKHISATRIVAVDQAITNFINSKITRRKQMKKKGALTDDLIFPDYGDILECVSRCNERKNLGLDKRRQEQMAKKAFIELGEFLQRTRRNDYWDTFSLYLENMEEDPAIKDKSLAEKLTDNRTEGEKRLAAVFEKFTKKQEEIKQQSDSGTTTEEEEEEEEEKIADDDDICKDDLSTASLSEEDIDNEEDINKKVKDNGLLVENGKDICGTRTINTYKNTDKVKTKLTNSNKATLDALQYNVKDKIETLTKESDVIESKSKNQIINKKTVQEVCRNNTVAKNVTDADAKIPKDSLPTCSTADCTNNNRIKEDVPEVTTEDTAKMITDPVIKTITETAKDVMPGIIAEPMEELMEDVTGVITGDDTEVIADDATSVTVIENMPNRSEEDKKPLLRVRSFAKPPTTWEVDSRQKIVKTAQETAPKITNPTNEIVDLTSETTVANKTSPTVTKCVQGYKVVPVKTITVPLKNPKLLVPTNRNIINVQNITNNYLKVNKRTGQIIARAPVGDIRASTIIRVPSAQTTTQQNQSQNTSTVTVKTNEVPFRGNETILRIIQNSQGKKSIIVSKKSSVQSFQKQINVYLPKTKPK